MMNAVANTLKHTHGAYGPSHMASRGTLLDVTKAPGKAPLGSSGIQIKMTFTELLDGYRPGRCVRLKCDTWAFVTMPSEERVKTIEEQKRSAVFSLP